MGPRARDLPPGPVRWLLDGLRAQGISDERVLDAMASVPRERFVRPLDVECAWDDRALPIGEGQTISQPFVVARMTEALALSGSERVLEVGTGSGYQAAILALLAREVHTVERIESHRDRAAATLAALGLRNVTCHLGDGSRGLPAHAPFDAILVTAAAPRIPEPLVEQLSEGGRLVLPVGTREVQRLRRCTRAERLITEDLESVVFVPLFGEHGW